MFKTIFANTIKRIFISPFNIAFLFVFPLLFWFLVSASSGDVAINDPMEMALTFGVTDLDNSILSNTLVRQLEERFRVDKIAEADITPKLTEQEIPWILLIPEGYGASVLAGELPALEGYSLTISDVSAMGSINAENITKALMLLGTEDENILAEWAEKSAFDVQTAVKNDNWEALTYWFGFFGFIAMFGAYFFAKTLADDKKRGMPDRLGTLPSSPRKLLISGAIAVFCATEITVFLLMLVVVVSLGIVPNMLLLFFILSLFNLFTVSLVLAAISIAKDLGTASVFVSLGATVFAMLGGSFWPLNLVPEFMQKLAWFSPNYWLMRGIGGVREVTFDGFIISVLFLGGFTLVAVLLGGWKNIQKMDDEVQ